VDDDNGEDTLSHNPFHNRTTLLFQQITIERNVASGCSRFFVVDDDDDDRCLLRFSRCEGRQLQRHESPYLAAGEVLLLMMMSDRANQTNRQGRRRRSPN